VTFPDIDELLALRSEAQGLRLRGRQASHAPVSGAHRSIQRGRGLEFQELRQYVSGDDPRTIDWRVTARRGRPHTKLFREERERPVWLLVDLGPSMFFGSRVQLKSALAVRAAALLAWSVVMRGDRVGGVVVNNSSVRVLPPRAREAGLLPLFTTLIRMQPRNVDSLGSNSLTEGLHSLASLARPGSLVCAISDFAGPNPRDEADWATIGMRSELNLFWVTDPLERQGPPDGRFRVWFRDQTTCIDGARTRATWLARWHEREDRIQILAQHSRSTVVGLDTAASVVDLMRDFLYAKASAA
jgi:uncharacterized protein (DUF58 family)